MPAVCKLKQRELLQALSRKMHGLAREVVESRTGPSATHLPVELCSKVQCAHACWLSKLSKLSSTSTAAMCPWQPGGCQSHLTLTNMCLCPCTVMEASKLLMCCDCCHWHASRPCAQGSIERALAQLGLYRTDLEERVVALFDQACAAGDLRTMAGCSTIMTDSQRGARMLAEVQPPIDCCMAFAKLAWARWTCIVCRAHLLKTARTWTSLIC